MDAPKIIRTIEYNNEVFKVGDICNYVSNAGFSEKTEIGRLRRVGDRNIEFDTSKPFDGRIKTYSIESLKSISHAAEQEE